jgi:hypothetical protein
MARDLRRYLSGPPDARLDSQAAAGPSHITPMTSDSRAASTTSLVTTERWLMSRIRWIWAISRPVRRKLPLVMRVIAATALPVV